LALPGALTSAVKVKASPKAQDLGDEDVLVLVGDLPTNSTTIGDSLPPRLPPPEKIAWTRSRPRGSADVVSFA
jgi:hypothetical protein